MCKYPKYVKNVNYVPNGNKALGDLPAFQENTSLYSRLKSTLAYIPVPCGTCSACLATRQMEVVQRARIAYSHSYAYMVTLTYQNSMLPYLVTSQGYKYAYADITDIQNMLKRIRKILPPFKYICASEYGGKRHRPHFHLVFFFEKHSTDTPFHALALQYQLDTALRSNWTRNISKSTRYPKYEPLCQYIKRGGHSTFDCHLITDCYGKSSDSSDVAFYVTKYCLKIDKWSQSLKSALFYNYDNWREYWQLLRPRLLISKGLGYISPESIDKTPYADLADKVKSWITFARTNKPDSGPLFVLADGRTQPLSKYYRTKYLTYEDAVFFADNLRNRLIPDGETQSLDNTIESKCLTPLQVANVLSDENKFVTTRLRLGLDNDDLDYFEILKDIPIFDPLNKNFIDYVEQNQNCNSAPIAPCLAFDDLCDVGYFPREVVQQLPGNCSDERNSHCHVLETGNLFEQP